MTKCSLRANNSEEETTGKKKEEGRKPGKAEDNDQYGESVAPQTLERIRNESSIGRYILCVFPMHVYG